MLQKKICLLGAFAVGKTSLVMRYVDSLFSDKYHTTVGVKIDKKTVSVDDTDMTLMIWDLAGQDDLTRLRTSYLRGTAGYIIVADGTRPFSLETAMNMHKEAQDCIGEVPYIIAINKADLINDGNWQITDAEIESLKTQGAEVLFTSAKTGEHVETMFQHLAQKMMATQPH